MSDDSLRRVDLTRLEQGGYQVTNERGGVLPIGSGEGRDFTPVELLLAAFAGCSAIDVDLITGPGPLVLGRAHRRDRRADRVRPGLIERVVGFSPVER